MFARAAGKTSQKKLPKIQVRFERFCYHIAAGASMTGNSVNITTLLQEWGEGDSEAGRQLMTETYAELRRIAAQYFRQEAPGHTLQATALAHELSIRLLASPPPRCTNTAHFLALAAQQARRVLVDHARRAGADKRAGKAVRLSLTDLSVSAGKCERELIEVDQALERLSRLDRRAARIVELRFFAGMTEEEIGEVLEISPATLHRDWQFARAWLLTQLRPRVE
jgi:RNA polymerase sigma factor (TIGR02999 family)